MEISDKGKMMKIQGNCVTGDPVMLDRYTANWLTVRLHPTTYYRRQDAFFDSFKSIKGLYAEIDRGEFICIRFTDKDDVTNFHKMHHEYI